MDTLREPPVGAVDQAGLAGARRGIVGRRLWLWVGLIGAFVLAAVAWLWLGQPLAGTVIDRESGQAVIGARVALVGQETCTDGQGSFRLRGLRGRPEARVEATGYQPLRVMVPIATLLGLGEPLVLPLEPVVLHGRVVDASTGAPLPGARVTVGRQTTVTDAEGHYQVLRVWLNEEISAEAAFYARGAVVPYTGQAEQNLSLQRLPAMVAVRDACLGHPIAGAMVQAGETMLVADEQGRATLALLEPGSTLLASAPGFREARALANPGDDVQLELAPAEVSGRVLGAAGEPLEGALVLARLANGETRSTYTDAAGEYRLTDVETGAEMLVRRGGYRRAERRLGTECCTMWQLEPFEVHAIYLGFHLLTADYHAQLLADLDLVERSEELNAVVIEIKTGGGFLAFEPQLPLARELGTDYFATIDLKALLADLKSRGIYTIARMPVFADNLLGTLRPEWAVHTPDGSVWRDALDGAWTDPFCQEVWEYNVALAKEAIALGFDEIQFDYVRFPSDGAVGRCRYRQESTASSRVEAITGFIAYARRELDPTGAFLSADLFGLTTFDAEEKGIGQLMERLGPYLDYVSPMVYPSTYLRGMLDLDDPWRSPYEVVKRSLDAAHLKTTTPIRPWLQHFDDYHGLGIYYDLDEYLAQKQAAADGGACGWMFWNIMGEYDARAFGVE